MSDTKPDTREQRQWWIVTETGVALATGYSCAPMNPTTWWFPSVGLSMGEGHLVFKTEREALDAAIKETRAIISRQQTKLESLISQWSKTT